MVRILLAMGIWLLSACVQSNDLPTIISNQQQVWHQESKINWIFARNTSVSSALNWYLARHSVSLSWELPLDCQFVQAQRILAGDVFAGLEKLLAKLNVQGYYLRSENRLVVRAKGEILDICGRNFRRNLDV